MKSSKLIDILKSLSENELKGLAVFIEKRIDKKDTLPQKLFLVLEKYSPVFDEKDLRKEKIYSKVFPKQKYNENKFSKLMSELTKIIESYIIHIKQQEDIIEEKMYLLKYYFERNLDKYFIIAARELRTLLGKLPIGSHQNILKYQFEELITTYELKIDNRTGDYQKVCSELTEFIESEKLRWDNLSLIDPSFRKKTEMPGKPFYIIHSRLNKMLVTKDEVHFFEVMDDIEKNIKLFAQEESREILKILLHFSIEKVNSGNYDYYVQQFKIYQLFINMDLILNHYGKIHIATYKNYINCALRLGKFKDAETFLEYYKQFLLEDIKEDVYNFNKAYILFEKGKFDDALTLLLTIKSDDIYYNLAQRRMIVKAYYELLQKDSSYFELFHSNINAFKKFIYTKDKLPEMHIVLNKNFLKMLHKMEDNLKADKKKVIQLLKELESTHSVGERLWLEKKLNALL